MFVKGVIDRLRRRQASRLMSQNSRVHGGHMAGHTQKAFLGKSILFFNIFQPVICICYCFFIPFVSIKILQHSQGSECKDSRENSCYVLQQYVNLWAYRPIESQAPFLEPKDESNGTDAQKVWFTINEFWHKYRATWPIDFLSSLIVLSVDIVRRVNNRRHMMPDAAYMFSMALLQFISGLLRSVQAFFYYTLLTKVVQLLDDLNVKIGNEAIARQLPDQYKYTMDLPKANFSVCVVGIFIGLLNLTLILDYMDPV